jgi:4-hydroxy-2-oxoheptanedioate aldolase
MRPNKLKQIWASGKSSVDCWLMLPSAISAELLAHQGWDSLTIDCEHGQADHAGMVQILTAISTTDAVPLVRVKWNDPGDIMRALDSGAYGIICPMIETVEEAEKFVGACRYTPMGYRSYGPRRAMIYGGDDYLENANDTVLAIAQIETLKGLKNIDAIAAVPGLDVLFLGPNDMRLTMGLKPSPTLHEPEMIAVCEQVVAAAKKAGKRSGMFCFNAEDANRMIAMGFDHVTATLDDVLLSAGAAVRKQVKT